MQERGDSDMAQAVVPHEEQGDIRTELEVPEKEEPKDKQSDSG